MNVLRRIGEVFVLLIMYPVQLAVYFTITTGRVVTAIWDTIRGDETKSTVEAFDNWFQSLD